jgi:YggT family protein
LRVNRELGSRHPWRRAERRRRDSLSTAALVGSGSPGYILSRLAACPGAAMRALLDVILLALNLYTWVIIASAILSWLVAFNVVNMRNDVVRAIWNGLYQLTEPVLRPIRTRLPAMGGLDISPIILLLIIFFIERVIQEYIYPNVF